MVLKIYNEDGDEIELWICVDCGCVRALEAGIEKFEDFCNCDSTHEIPHTKLSFKQSLLSDAI